MIFGVDCWYCIICTDPWKITLHLEVIVSQCLQILMMMLSKKTLTINFASLERIPLLHFLFTEYKRFNVWFARKVLFVVIVFETKADYQANRSSRLVWKMITYMEQKSQWAYVTITVLHWTNMTWKADFERTNLLKTDKLSLLISYHAPLVSPYYCFVTEI